MKTYIGHILISFGLALLLVAVQSCNVHCRASVELPGMVAGCVR